MKSLQIICTLVVLLLFSNAAPASDRFLVLDLGNTQPGQYVFVVTVASDGTVTYKRPTVVVVGGGGNPDPQPPTGPPQPPPLTGLAAKVAGWVKSDISHDGWQAEAVRLAEGYERVAGMMETKQIKDPLEIAPAQLAANLGAVGQESHALWAPVLGRFANHLRAELSAGRIRQVSDHAPLWRQFAAGLRGAK